MTTRTVSTGRGYRAHVTVEARRIVVQHETQHAWFPTLWEPRQRDAADGEPVEPYTAPLGEGRAPAPDASVAAPARVPSSGLAEYLRELGDAGTRSCPEALAAFALCDASWLVEAGADPVSVLKTLDLMRLPEPYARRVREWLAPLLHASADDAQSVAGDVPSSPATPAPRPERVVESALGTGAPFDRRTR